MTLKKRIFTGIGALAFMALLALNVQLVKSSQGGEEGFASLSLVELAASAQSEGGGGGGGSTGTCCPTTSGATCIIGIYYQDNAYYLSEGDCPPLNS